MNRHVQRSLNYIYLIFMQICTHICFNYTLYYGLLIFRCQYADKLNLVTESIKVTVLRFLCMPYWSRSEQQPI